MISSSEVIIWFLNILQVTIALYTFSGGCEKPRKTANSHFTYQLLSFSANSGIAISHTDPGK